MVLGGNARAVGRRQNLRELARDGADREVISVTMCNSSPEEGYRHDIYGGAFTVERAVSKGRARRSVQSVQASCKIARASRLSSCSRRDDRLVADRAEEHAREAHM